MRVINARAALLGTAAALFSTTAIAQTAQQTAEEGQQALAATEATAAPSPEAQDSATGEIVVTARRTEERLQRVPAAISAFNERALDRIQAQDTTGLQGAVPNLNIVQGRGSSNATNIYIRGIGQPDALQTFDPAVGVYVDDVYLSRIRGNQLDLLDVDRIEVLRGPQGTLYGKNTIGGAIKFVTHRPGQQTRANASVAVGTYGQIEGKGTISGPLINGIAGGLSILASHHDGFVDNPTPGDHRTYNDKNAFGTRADLAITPASNVRIDLSADYSQDKDALNVGRPVNNLTTFSGTVLVVDDPVGSGSYDWEGRTTPHLPNSTKLKHYGFAGTAAIDVTDAITLKSITAYRNLKTDDYIDIDATQYSVGDVFVGVRQHQFSQEFQATYTSDRLSGVVGLYYLKENITSHQEAYADDLFGPLFGNPTFLRTIDDDLTLHSYAAFANASYEIVPNVRLSGGIRFTKEKKDYFRTTTTFLNGAVLNPPFEFIPHDTWKDTSPMASVDWQVTPTTMVYARIAKGFKSGGFNGRANNPNGSESTAYDPETVWSYEGGFKTTIANQLRVNGAVFTSDYKNFQARVADTDTSTFPPTPLLSVLNAGKLRISGAELEAAWTPMSALLIDGQLGYLDAEYKDFDDARFTNFGGSRAFQTPAFSPKWTLRLGAQYAFDVGSAGGITVGGQTRYRSRQALAVDNTFVNTDTEIEGLFQDGYWVEDARIEWENASKKLALGLYGYNLTKKAYKTDAQEFSSVGGIRTVYYGAPRTFTLRLTARY